MRSVGTPFGNRPEIQEDADSIKISRINERNKKHDQETFGTECF
jgi:hypothetical protein